MDEMQPEDLRQLNRRFDEIVRDGNKREEAHTMAHEKLSDQIEKISDQNKRQAEMLVPIAKIFNSVQGFNGIAIWILKAIILFGAALTAVYGIMKWLRG